MKRRNCVGTPTLPVSYYKDLLPKCQILRCKYRIKNRRSRETPPIHVLRLTQRKDYFLSSAIAACAAASRAIGTRNGLQET
jgi:hypothetical protein